MNEDRGLERLNSLAADDAAAEFLKCCGSRKWARRMTLERPFPGFDELCDTADRVWWSHEPQDWLEAFQSHPKIGEQNAASAVAAQAQKWSADEQAGLHAAATKTIEALAQSNRLYEEKFGYIFIVCASGKSSEEMLAILRARLENSPEVELKIAAAEQAKITRLRLAKLLEGAP